MQLEPEPDNYYEAPDNTFLVEFLRIRISLSVSEDKISTRPSIFSGKIDKDTKTYSNQLPDAPL